MTGPDLAPALPVSAVTAALAAAAAAPPAEPGSEPVTGLPSSPHASSLSGSGDDDDDDDTAAVAKPRLRRPRLNARKSSGTIVVPRDSEMIEMVNEQYDEDDARCMSPRRSQEEIERLERGARESLIAQAKALQASLLALVDRVETIKTEHEKLEGGNKFLQSYIGELMQTSRITSSGAPKSKGKPKGRSGN